MNEKNTEHTIELIGGYTTPDNDGKTKTTHRAVTFGRRLTTQELINLDNDPQGQNPTQYDDLVRRKMITKFGTMKMPVPLNALLSLDSLDRQDLSAAADKFMVESRGDSVAEIREDNEVKLRWGFDVGGTFYDVVQFGKLTTGKDSVDADALGRGVARECFLIGKQITKILTSDGTASIDGAVGVESFFALDVEDFNQLRIGAKLFEVAFRLKREAVSRERNGDGRVSAGKGNENVGSGDSGDAGNAN